MQVRGGDHRYLGLILHNIEYASLSNVPFVAPQYPQPLQIPPGTHTVDALNLHEQYKEQKHAYFECKNVEKALHRHIQDDIEGKYLKTLVDKDTQLILNDILVVLDYLFEI